MGAGKVTRWIAVGVDDQGKLVGLMPIKLTTEGLLTHSVHLPNAILILKDRSITSVPSISPTDKLSSPKYTIEYFHAYFQKKMAATFGGYPGLSFKDRENWKQLLAGFKPDLLVSMIDAFVDQHASAMAEITGLPDTPPTLGILRGWAASIVAWTTGKHSRRSGNVRNFSRPAKSEEGKF